ncbi:MAG: hypothetical protein AAB536_01960 [Patescibacteria group bacterium]
MTKIVFIGGIALVVIIVLSLGAYIYFKRPVSEVALNVSPDTEQTPESVSVLTQETTSTPQSEERDRPLSVREIQQEFVADFSDSRTLVGGSQYIFVARIIKKVGNETNITWMPRTQFEAEVISNIKGNLSGKVIVSQVGGYIDGVLYVANSDLLGPADAPGAGRLLQVGSTYLLPTRHIPNTGWGAEWYHVNSFPGAIGLISEDQNLTTVQLNALVANDSRAKQLQMAYPNDVLLTSDIRNGWTINSYQSLTEAQKAALPYYAGSYNPNPTSTATSTQ